MQKSLTRRTLLSTTASAAIVSATDSAAAARRSERTTSPTLSSRVRDLLARMTLDEKVAQLQCMWERKIDFLNPDNTFSEARAREVLRLGIGQMSRISDIRGRPEWNDHPFRTIADTVQLANDVQRFLVEGTRLGIPSLFHDELAHGLLAGAATVFPSPPALGSTWDTDLVEAVFTAAARQARARGSHIALTPVIDLARDPRFGRVEEMFGEDPHHVAQMGIAAVRGLQGRTRPLAHDRVFATLKHFVHAVPRGGLNLASAEVGERALRATYLVPFAEVIAHADPAIIMPSYNEVDGVPSHMNRDLMNRIAREDLGFRGMFSSDYSGVENLMTQHRVAETLQDAAALAINAGVAVDLPEGKGYAHLPALVRSGRVSMATLDAAVSHVLALKFEAGLFEEPYLDLARAIAQSDTEADVELARIAAEKAVILLKNDGVLPLAPSRHFRLAVIGPNASEPLFGGYSGDNANAVGILEGVTQAAAPNIIVEHADGVWITSPDAIGRRRSYSPIDEPPLQDNRRRIREAVALARRSDAVLLVVGDVPALSREGIGATLPGDRSTLELWGMQNELVEALAGTGVPLISLMLNGRPLAIPRLAEVSNALLEGWYLGQQGGIAFANILFGRANPGGKLAVSLPRSVGELPIYYNRQPSDDLNTYLEGGARQPLFPFGHGLSYTTFEISAPRLQRELIEVGETWVFDVDVANTGPRTGDEVVQIYITDDISSLPRPQIELKAFKRITLGPGERQTLRFELPHTALAFWDINMQQVVEPGTFRLSAGPSSASLKSVQFAVR